MFASLSLIQLILIFSVATAAVWFAGIQLSNYTDIIDKRFGFSQAFGGLIFLSFATNLPEIAIVGSASLAHNIGIAIGNILGGIAIQTVVLVLLDAFGLGHRDPLSYRAASLQLILEGILVIIVLVITIMGTQLPLTVMYDRVAPGDLLIVIAWLIGVWLVSISRSQLPWHQKINTSDTFTAARRERTIKFKHDSTAHVILMFVIASIVTLAAGVALEESGSAIASHIGLSGVIFGSTILAAITSLPEISTGLAAVKLGDYTLAFSDIFGGNAFLPVLFMPATLLSGESVLPQAKNTDIYLASLSALLTAVYIYGIIFKYRRQYFCLGIDSIVVTILYIFGMIGLIFITHTF